MSQTGAPIRKDYPHFPGSNHPDPIFTLDQVTMLARLLASRLFNEAMNGDPNNNSAGSPPGVGDGGRLLSEISDIVYGYDSNPTPDNKLIDKIKSIVPEIDKAAAAMSPPRQAEAYDVFQVWSTAMSIFTEILGSFELLIKDYDNDSAHQHSSNTYAMAMPDPNATKKTTR